MKLFCVLIFIGAFLFCKNLQSQEQIELPQHFGQFYNNPIINIANNGLDSKVDLRMDNQRNTGGFGGVSTSYLSLFYTHTHKKSKNIYGLFFYNDKEGDFLFRRRALLSYSRHQQISNNWTLSLGLSMGFYVFGIKPNSSTGGYSSYSFEGNSSLLLYSKNTKIGLSVNQFSNSLIRPVSQEMRLKRHYYFYGQHKFSLYSKVSTTSSAYVRYVDVTNQIIQPAAVAIGFSQRIVISKVMFGGSIDNGVPYATIGLTNLTFGNNTIDFDFSYKIPISNTNTINVNLIELNLRYQIMK